MTMTQAQAVMVGASLYPGRSVNGQVSQWFSTYTFSRSELRAPEYSIYIHKSDPRKNTDDDFHVRGESWEECVAKLRFAAGRIDEPPTIAA